MHRRLHLLAVMLIVLLTVTGWSSASMSPFAAPAGAQVVTPDPSPPSSVDLQGVLVVDNVDITLPTFATGQLDDPNAFPETTVRVHNEKGFWQDQNF